MSVCEKRLGSTSKLQAQQLGIVTPLTCIYIKNSNTRDSSEVKLDKKGVQEVSWINAFCYNQGLSSDPNP